LGTKAKPRSLWSDTWRGFKRHRLALVGIVVLGILALFVTLGPMVWPASSSRIDFDQRLLGPSAAHPMGTDDLGRDLMARLMIGGRISLAVGLVAMAVAISLGTLIGALAGSFGGAVDGALMRLADLALSLPLLPMLLLTIYLFRDTMQERFGYELGIFLLIVGLVGLLSWMPAARLVRASFLSAREQEYVLAAQAIGVRRTSLILRHMLPNSLGPIVVAATLDVGAAIVTESSLSFLGVGFPPDVPTWGSLLFYGRDWMDLASWLVIFPGLAIFLTVISINYAGDGLRDALDPRRSR
jgi:peptide/nickel transport system permease protein